MCMAVFAMRPRYHVRMKYTRLIYVMSLSIPLVAVSPSVAQKAPTAAEVSQTLDRAISYYTSEVATNGGYVYYYSLDLTKRLGEGVATKSQIWVQPPGTPSVGVALLDAYNATKNETYLRRANEAAYALIYGQLKSGAWTNSIDFDPQGQTAAYRNGRGQGRNFSTLDDDISQSSLQFLMRCDQANGFEDQKISEAVKTGLSALLNAQFANGAFPQGWDGPIARQQRIVKASYPSYDWRTEGRIKEYWDMYTLNDGLAGTVSETLLLAHDIYQRQDCLDAVKKFGDFLIMAQMPEPQPAWAQQYGYDMHPIWARRFEPPAIAGRESEDVLITLMRLYRVTGEPRYLAPVEPAIDYLQRSELPDGRMARYYELKTNRPLYMRRTGGRNYVLTHDDSELPKHYGWKNSSKVKPLRRMLAQATSREWPKSPSVKADTARKMIDQLDSRGRWVSRYGGEKLVGQPKFQPAEQYLSSAVFCENVAALSAFLRQQSQ